MNQGTESKPKYFHKLGNQIYASGPSLKKAIP